ncbi:Gfo/Idh/MocA family protein [Alteraurantiacibacter palmitatis]|uniref:Gfo/Idh/MocA family protein n=1 Tax=Alteraurantiacibacter palmitatis TaxID=2054628 RepID=A0ABV7E910_9SPHN
MDKADKTGTNLSRRELLAGGAAAASLAALSASTSAQEAIGQPLLGNPQLPDMPGERMRWAIVGLGTFAVGQVIPGFGDARHSRITAFVSGNAEKARTLGAAYGVSRFYDYAGYDAIANDPEIDCVFIALPVGLHAEYTIRALQAGKHVLCEKPMCSTVAEAEAMVAAARAANRQLGVAYRVHFEPNNRDTLRRITAGELGALRHVSADHGFSANPQYPPHKWRLEKQLAGGGSLFDIGVYGINTSLMMLPGDRVVGVTAHYSTPAGDARFAEVEGGVDYRLRMASGINVQGSSSYCWSPYVSRQRYFGADASIEMQPATTYDDNRILLEGGGQPPREFRAGNPMQQFAAQVDGFSAAARANVLHLTPGEMGLRDMRIMEAIYASADADGAVVAVDIPV